MTTDAGADSKVTKRVRQMAEMAQAMLSDATIARRLGIRARAVRNKLSIARAAGYDIPLNGARIAHEHARGGVRLQPLSDAEIARLERAGRARKMTASDVLARVVRELVSADGFPTLIDNILDDGVSS